MLKRSIITAAILLFSSIAAAQTYRSGVLLVSPKAGVSQQAFDSTLKQHGARSTKRLGTLNVFEVSVPHAAEQAAITALSKNKNIKFAELDWAHRPSYTANDTYYSNAWHLHKMQIPVMWDLSEGSNITIAIADTGTMPTHPDLVANLLPGFNAVDGTRDSTDINGHGTSTAGTAGAVTNNALGIPGVAGKVKILPIRISNTADGWAYSSSMATAINLAADNGARVVNLSYSGGGSASSVQSAAAYMVSKGGVVVYAAGNAGIDEAYYDNPNIILVSATNSNDTRTSWSSFGTYVDVAAPGEGIWVTRNGGGYETASGTSFSAPIVTGVVAAMLSANPNLVQPQVDKILKDTTVDIGTVGEDIYYGAGRVNALAAVTAALNAPILDSISPITKMISPISGATLRDTALVSVSATDSIGVTKVEVRLGNTLVATESVPPYEFAIDTLAYPNGTYTLTATSYDAAHNSSTDSIQVYLANNDYFPPVINISNPINGSIVGGKKPIKIIATAIDDTPVTQNLYVNNNLVYTTISSNLTYNWSVSKISAGLHTIKVVATDSSGNSASSTVSVTKN